MFVVLNGLILELEIRTEQSKEVQVLRSGLEIDPLTFLRGNKALLISVCA